MQRPTPDMLQTANMLESVIGTWRGAVTGSGPVAIQAKLSWSETGEIKATLQLQTTITGCKPCGEIWEVALKALSPSVLVNDGEQRCVSYEQKANNAWQVCPYGSTSKDISVTVVGGNREEIYWPGAQLQVHWGHDSNRAVWGGWQGDTFVLSRSSN
jgi:hypothetical protein